MQGSPIDCKMTSSTLKKLNKSEKPKKGVETTTAAKPQTTNEPKLALPSKISHSIEYEFGGPVGAFAVIVFLPLVVYALFFLCNKDVCLENPMEFNWSLWISDKYVFYVEFMAYYDHKQFLLGL